MADIKPFRGWRFDPLRVPLAQALCPPYDIVSPEEAARLRRRPESAAHLELPAGRGAARWARAAAVWRRWVARGVLRQDPQPSFYVCEQSFRFRGRGFSRRGLLGALAVGDRCVLEHERTLPKPKAERLALLRALRVNTSPIFGVCPDLGGGLGRLLAAAARRRPDAAGASVRLWRISEDREVAALSRLLSRRELLIADGHHRFAVSRLAGAEDVLAYICPEDGPGLVVLPTHRVAARSDLEAGALRCCRLTPCRGWSGLRRRLAGSTNPYAFGLYDGVFRLAEPRGAGGCRSGLSVEWVERYLIKRALSYTPDEREALARARRLGAAVFIKPLTVRGVRLAARRVGLLPPKTTYFLPKVPAGLVFKEL